MAKTQNPFVPDPRFDEFNVPSLDDFVDGNRDELLLYPIRALGKYIARTEQYYPGIECQFVSTLQRKKMSQNTIIINAYISSCAEDCRDLPVKAHEVQKVEMSLLFEGNCTVHQVLKVGTRSFVYLLLLS